MRKVMRPRYYCDFCKKSGGGGYAMTVHERYCTNNPARGCRMCAHTGGGDGLPDLILIALKGDVAALRVAASGCPACMLAAIRQAPWPKDSEFDFMIRPDDVNNWTFKDEMKIFEWSQDERDYAY